MIEATRVEARRILVVEDERVVARDLCRTLEDMGYQVGGAARSAEEALEQTVLQVPDLVLMDIRIKGPVDGIEAAAQLKQRHQVPVVFLTASMDEATQRRAFLTEPDGYLPKPFSRATLRTAIEVALQRQRIESRLREINDELTTRNSELQQRSCELGLLSEMGDIFPLCDSADEVLAAVVRFGRQLFPAAAGALYLIDGSGSELSIAATWGRYPSTANFEVDGCRALRKGQLHRVVPPDDQLRCAHLESSPESGSICVPMTANGTSHGILSLTFAVTGRVAASEMRAKEQLATLAAQRIGLTLANLRIREQLRRESILDSLTGLFNRRYMANALDRELRLASRGDRSIGVLILDIDHFKRINDQFGHAAADWVLCEQARLLRSRLRASDVPTRYGGDEIVVLLPDTGADGAEAVAKHLRQAIRDMQVVYGGHVLPSVSVSVGVACYPIHGSDAESVLQAADRALYQAKAQGRDCVVVADCQPVTDAGEISAGRVLSGPRDAVSGGPVAEVSAHLLQEGARRHLG